MQIIYTYNGFRLISGTKKIIYTYKSSIVFVYSGIFNTKITKKISSYVYNSKTYINWTKVSFPFHFKIKVGGKSVTNRQLSSRSFTSISSCMITVCLYWISFKINGLSSVEAPLIMCVMGASCCLLMPSACHKSQPKKEGLPSYMSALCSAYSRVLGGAIHLISGLVRSARPC